MCQVPRVLQQANQYTVFLLAGVTTEAELSSPENKIHPDFVTSKLPDLLEAAKGSPVPA